MDRNPNIDAFDSEAEVLARLSPFSASYVQGVRPLLSRLHLAETESGVIIELGCARGNLTRALLEVFPAAKVIWVDGALQLIDIARRQTAGEPRASFIVSPFEELDWGALPQNCAAVVAVFALEHVAREERCEKIFKGIRNILRKGGVFLDKEWARDTTPPGTDTRDRSRPENMPDFMRQAIEEGRITEEEHWRLWDKLAQPETHHFMDLDKQLDALRKAGFSEVSGEWDTESVTIVEAQK
ncbi:MAG: methyltransferase domain-containing protein [Armatimonadetes bacterium]|nr:methyltransferase domain-containing protein [Armatimonadota bacterium]NIM24172.1 methyltransferase domain-containing protein [Armatimonadota bacterium]NIM68031.1 methyltransferase domain-containing protein [Armatimonadota bacterium]NIM76526.1 methyltransferase domain-containing protein [Armatimonadota bacterium]NIN06265.1 methyltransferase domain-containing protein [Armatimonadota bacterium]